MKENDPQSVLYKRFVVQGEEPDPFNAKRLYPGLTVADAVARCSRLAAQRHMQLKRMTQQEIIGREALHHRDGDRPAWSGEPFDWPICDVCAADIFTTGDTESGPLWACSDAACRRR